MGWLTKASETVFGPASESDQQRTPDSDTEQALVGNQEVAQRAGVEARQTAGTVVAKAGDSVSGLALKGTGDAHRYPELNTFNRRNAEDASLESGDIFDVPPGWDVAKMGGVAPAGPPAGAEAEAGPVEAQSGEHQGMDIWQVVAAGQQALGTAAKGAQSTAQSAYDAAYGYADAGREALWGKRVATPNNQNLEQAEQDDEVQEVAAGIGAEQGLDADQRRNYVRYTEDGAVDKTVEGATPLDIALEKSKAGDAGTSYRIDEAALEATQSGAANADTFWCSGFLIWTLAAHGMDVNAAVIGKNGQPYSYKNAGGRDYPITVKRMMDGEPESVGAMAYAGKQNIDGGYIGRCGTDFDAGYGSDKFEGDASEHDLAVKGAAGAFVMAGIGTEVPQTDQRPGDFNQARWKGVYRYYANDAWHDDHSKPIDYYGQGHAWLTNTTVVRGSAWVGLPASPLLDGAASSEVRWVSNAQLTLTSQTDPNLVGEITEVLSAERVEANTKGGIERSQRARTDGALDGGVQVTASKDVPAQSRHDGYFVYCGRLNSSSWSNHQAASADIAPPGAPAPQVEQSPEVQEPTEQAEQSWSDWAKEITGL